MTDRDWREELYRKHRRSLFLTAWNVLRCTSLAEDAVHSAFVGLSELAAAPVEPKLYAFRAVRNAAIDLARRRGRQSAELIPHDDDGVPSIEVVPQSDSRDELEQALSQLEQPAREVVELRLHGDLTFQEIADLYNEPLPTITSRYRRAIEKLRQLLEVYHE